MHFNAFTNPCLSCSTVCAHTWCTAYVFRKKKLWAYSLKISESLSLHCRDEDTGPLWSVLYDAWISLPPSRCGERWAGKDPIKSRGLLPGRSVSPSVSSLLLRFPPPFGILTADWWSELVLVPWLYLPLCPICEIPAVPLNPAVLPAPLAEVEEGTSEPE